MMALAIDNARLTREVEESADAARVLTYVADGVVLVDQTGRSASGTRPPRRSPAWPRRGDRPRGRRRDRRLEGARRPHPGRHRGGTVQPETFPLETSRGERWISISGVDFFGGIVYAFRDVTDARRLEELKADFVATASHELRTPLAAVYGAAHRCATTSRSTRRAATASSP